MLVLCDLDKTLICQLFSSGRSVMQALNTRSDARVLLTTTVPRA